MKHTLCLTIIICLIFPGLVSAQQFEIIPDSTDGVGTPDKLCTFYSTFINHWDQENSILWETEAELPEGWALEICQTGLTCWPEWITSDTMVLPANVIDTLEVKFYTSETEGTGRVTISLIALADRDIHQEHSFSLRVGPGGVSLHRDGKLSGTGVSFKLRGPLFSQNGMSVYLPKRSLVNVSMFDIQGRKVNSIWKGYLDQGENILQMPRGFQPSGAVYLLRVEAEGLGIATGKVISFR